MNGGKKVWCRCRAEDKIEQRLYVSEVIGFAIKGNMAKTKCQRFVERFGKAHKNQSGGLGITEKFPWRKNVYFVEEKIEEQGSGIAERYKVDKKFLLSDKLCNTIKMTW